MGFEDDVLNEGIAGKIYSKGTIYYRVLDKISKARSAVIGDKCVLAVRRYVPGNNHGKEVFETQVPFVDCYGSRNSTEEEIVAFEHAEREYMRAEVDRLEKKTGTTACTPWNMGVRPLTRDSKQ